VSEPARSSLTAKDTELMIPALEGRARLRRVLFAVAALAGGVAAYLYFTREPPAAELYRTIPVERRTLVQAVEAAGKLDVQSRVEVPAPAAGRLMAIHVTPGDTVKAGQLLAELDPRAAALAVGGAVAAVEAAAGRLSQARARKEAAAQSLQTAKTLLARGLASPQDVTEAEAELAQASAAVDAARGEQRVAGESVASAKLTQNLSRMEAPVAGVVLRAPERLGAAVSPDAGPLFVIGDPLTTMRVDASVSETEVASIKAGQRAEVFVTALPGQSFQGRVERVFIEPERREGAVLYPVRLSVENPQGALLPGMTVRARMEVARAENVLSAHEAALRFVPSGVEPGPQRSRVFRRVSPRQIEPVSVRTLISDGVYAQIEALDGDTLREHDQLAVGLLRPESGSGGPNVTLGDKKK
jgi:HlyD family secretion protein